MSGIAGKAEELGAGVSAGLLDRDTAAQRLMDCSCLPGDPRSLISRMAAEIQKLRADFAAEYNARMRLTASIDAVKADHADAAAKALRDFADLLRDMSARGVNQRITEALVSVANLARREADKLAGGEQP